MHGVKFYNPKHDTSGIVTDDTLSINGYYTVYYPTKDIYCRYNKEKILDLLKIEPPRGYTLEHISARIDADMKGLIGVKLVNESIVKMYASGPSTFEPDQSKQAQLFTLYFPWREYA